MRRQIEVPQQARRANIQIIRRSFVDPEEVNPLPISFSERKGRNAAGACAMIFKTGADSQMCIPETRCPWVDLSKPDYVKYHDTEWGVPVHHDRLLFEFLILEAFQAGLSWYTILKRRETFREAFDNFDPARVARYDERKVLELLGNPGIIRNRAKILAAINNAAKFMEVQRTFGSFDSYIWSFVENTPIVNSFRSLEEFPAKTPLSEAISRDLAQKGFAFVGPTIIYAHMQATGMVNDHTLDCYRRQEIMSLTRIP